VRQKVAAALRARVETCLAGEVELDGLDADVGGTGSHGWVMGLCKGGSCGKVAALAGGVHRWLSSSQDYVARKQKLRRCARAISHAGAVSGNGRVLPLKGGGLNCFCTWALRCSTRVRRPCALGGLQRSGVGCARILWRGCEPATIAGVLERVFTLFLRRLPPPCTSFLVLWPAASLPPEALDWALPNWCRAAVLAVEKSIAP
jgi:hypothetical protein